MRAGKLVAYIKAGRTQDATVVRVLEPGPSGYKRLDLDCAKGVKHRLDATGGTYWVEVHEREHATLVEVERTTDPTPVVPESSDKGHATAGAGAILGD